LINDDLADARPPNSNRFSCGTPSASRCGGSNSCTLRTNDDDDDDDDDDGTDDDDDDGGFDVAAVDDVVCAPVRRAVENGARVREDEALNGVDDILSDRSVLVSPLALQFVKKTSPKLSLSLIHLVSLVAVASASGIQTTWHCHLQQPIYMPNVSAFDSRTYQLAFETMTRNTCEEDLSTIFGKPDRVAAYQTRMVDALNTVANLPDAGMSVSYAADLMRNVDSLGQQNALGYSPGWANTYKSFNAKTSSGKPKLDFVWFSYHHVIAPLVDREALRKELAIFALRRGITWGSSAAPTFGFFPAEMSFSERIIPILNEFGIKWTIVSNNHISRLCSNYTFSSYGDNNDPPNQSSMNPPQQNWFRMSISRGCVPNNAVPFAFQPHRARYVAPDTGVESKIIVVPAAQAISWQDGYECITPQSVGLDKLAPLSDPARPMLVLMAHDCDNDFAGGYSWAAQCVNGFANAATSIGMNPTTVEEYLARFPVPQSDVVHVEDGAWVNADGDFGAPQFLNWNWPLLNKSGGVDVLQGWEMKERNWAVIVAAQARVLHAESLMPAPLSISEIERPTANANVAEIAWHFFVPSQTSGYMYYGSSLDMPIKPVVSANIANAYADQVIPKSTAQCVAGDKVAPTVWAPQRLPWNPGGFGAGALWKYRLTRMPHSFFVWTFVADACGPVQQSALLLRTDTDRTIDDCNRVFDPRVLNATCTGAPPSAWTTVPMKTRPMPKGNVFGLKGVDFSVLPTYIADEIFVHIDPTPCRACNIDYYVRAVDQAGNVKRTDIYHVWIEP
jgi:hypothetical protein